MLGVSLDLDPSHDHPPWRSHGLELPVDCLFGQGIDLEVHLTLSPETHLGTVMFPLGALRRWAEELGWPGFDGELQPRQNVHVMPSHSANGLRRFLRRLFAMAEQSPERLQTSACQRLIQIGRAHV